jgi:N-acetylneuraminic acid mutarotase
LTNIIVSPPNPIIGAGTNQQFAATGYYSDGSSKILTDEVTGGGGWTAVAGLPMATVGAACATVNNQFYVVAGSSGNINVFSYNPVSNVWTTNASFPFVDSNASYAYAGAVGIGTKIYVMGGCGDGNCIYTGNELEIYDTTTNGWSAGAPMPTPTTQMGVGVINGKIYVAGGAASGLVIAQSGFQIYDPASNTWTSGQSMPVAVDSYGVAVINDKLYVVGGYDNNGTTLGSLLVYDPTTDRWTTNAPLPTPRGSLGAAAVNGLLYAIDGQTTSGMPTNLVEVYNPATNGWSTGAPTLIAHSLIQPVVINGTIYVAGGGPGDTSVTNAESYTPQSSLWSSSSPTVASINTNGLAMGLTNGVTTITATSGSVSGNATLTVVSSPAISTQPADKIVSFNSSVTLSVSATGGVLSYQWQFDGTNINSATGASLTITNVSVANTGVYTVIVNNAAGSVTSTSVTLAIASVGIKLLGGVADVIVSGPLDSNYVIQATSNLLGSWTTLTNVSLPTQPYIYIDYSSPTNPRQFYRAVPQ